jgi:methyl-accepting chemotaxis protein
MAHTEREQVGLAYAREVVALVPLLQEQRQQASRGQGEAATAAARAELAESVSNQLTRIAALDAQQGASLGTTDALEVLRGNVDKAAQHGGSNPLAGYRRHAQAVEAAFVLLDAIVDGSGLAVDPDLATKYLIEAEVIQLPRVADSALAMGDLAAAIAQGAPREMSSGFIAPQRAIGLYLDARIRQALDRVGALHPAFAARLGYAPTQEALNSLHELAAAAAQQDWSGSSATVDPVQRTMRERSAALQQGLRETLDQLMAARVREITRQRMAVWAMLAVSLGLATYMFVAFARVMQGGLGEVRRHLSAMTEGDLTTSPRPWGQDEAAQLMLELRKMQDSLRTMVLRVRRSSDDIVQSSGDIAHAAGDLSVRTEQAAANLQQSAASMEQLASTVQATTDHTAEAARIARQSAQKAGEGGEQMSEVTTTMEAIRTASGRINDITATIDALAFQTNILALNAAVEAARAGAQGRGFAVVANEVRTLAQRSAEAAREIKGLIDRSNRQVEQGAATVRKAGSTISEIVNTARRVDELLAEVSSGAQEQSQGVVQVGQAVQELDRMTQQNAAMVQQTTTAAQGMSDQAATLAREVARFRLPAVE